MVKPIPIILLSIFCACCIYAQTTYKRVTLDRGKDSETNCIYVFNDNADSVKVFIQYKIGDRYTAWIDYPVPQLIPPSILEPQLIGCVDSAIIGLNLLDVKIIKRQMAPIKENEKSEKHNQEGFFQKVKTWFSED